MTDSQHMNETLVLQNVPWRSSAQGEEFVRRTQKYACSVDEAWKRRDEHQDTITARRDYARGIEP